VGIKRHQFVAISGCSGGGKSTLLHELAGRGYQVFSEPGRQIVKEQLHIGGDAYPWADAEKFVELVVSRAMHQMVNAACGNQLAFFDRGIIDAFCFLERRGSPVPPYMSKCVEKFRYNEKVFLAPPWREIYRNDEERRHSFDEAEQEYRALLVTYKRCGYKTVELPKLDVVARANFILATLEVTNPALGEITSAG
jgi:predicted ATPase